MRIWIIGAGGLLGSAIVRAIQRRMPTVDAPFRSPALPWEHPARLRDALHDAARAFQGVAGNEPWAVIWAAGRASTSSTDAQSRPELDALAALLEALHRHRPAGPGAFLLASSAGGIYAGAEHPPFTSETPAAPVSAYGRLKVAQEALVAEALGAELPVVIARFSNLYGPGQDLGKLQGLISRLALSAITKEPVTMFVPLDTLRDYLYVDDAADIALQHLDAALMLEAGSRVVVIASGQPTPLGRIIHTVEDVARVRIPVAYGTHPSAASQARDLRLEPTGGARISALVATTLPAGVRRVLDDIAERHRGASGMPA